MVTGWQVVALVVTVLGCALALLLLLPPTDRRQVLSDAGGVVAPYVAPVLAAVAAAVAAWAARAARHETARQTPLIEAAVTNTNGALSRRDERIAELESTLAAVTGSTVPPPSPDEGPGAATMAGFPGVTTTTTTIQRGNAGTDSR